MLRSPGQLPCWLSGLVLRGLEFHWWRLAGRAALLLQPCEVCQGRFPLSSGRTPLALWGSFSPGDLPQGAHISRSGRNGRHAGRRLGLQRSRTALPTECRLLFLSSHSHVAPHGVSLLGCWHRGPHPKGFTQQVGALRSSGVNRAPLGPSQGQGAGSSRGLTPKGHVLQEVGTSVGSSSGSRPALPVPSSAAEHATIPVSSTISSHTAAGPLLPPSQGSLSDS